MSHEDRDDGHDGRDGPDGPQGGSRRGDKAAEGLAPPGREEEIPEPLKLVLADLRASPEDAVRIVPAAGPVTGLRHAPHRGSSEKVDQAQRAQDRDHGERECVLLPACDGRSEEYVSPVFPHEPREGPFLPSSSCHDRPSRRDCTLAVEPIGEIGAYRESRFGLCLNRRVNPGLRSVQGGSG